ncbi:hypothetical protein SNE40_001365 [Patella caerulea]|uniref:Hemicentin-1 n=1 Tax=Patella caerulea TaxID=87958 RepID=A0AAN8KFT4_PATCE
MNCVISGCLAVLFTESLLINLCLAGSWSEWGAFSGCSKTCGDGLITRKSTWVPSEGETPLDKPATMTDKYPCNLGKCPVDGKWSGWGAWSACTEACGGGNKKRERTCSNPEPVAGGEPCEGLNWEEEECNKVSCPPLPSNFNITKCNAQYFMCDSKKMCVPKSEECNKVVQCHDGSDEKYCYRIHVVDGNGGRYETVKGRSGSSQNEVMSVLLGILSLACLMFVLH